MPWNIVAFQGNLLLMGLSLRKCNSSTSSLDRLFPCKVEVTVKCARVTLRGRLTERGSAPENLAAAQSLLLGLENPPLPAQYLLLAFPSLLVF